MGSLPLEVPPGQCKTHVYCNRRPLLDGGKVNRKVSDFPRAKQLPWVHLCGQAFSLVISAQAIVHSVRMNVYSSKGEL